LLREWGNEAGQLVWEETKTAESKHKITAWSKQMAEQRTNELNDWGTDDTMPEEWVLIFEN
jgi:hypothetical protein